MWRRTDSNRGEPVRIGCHILADMDTATDILEPIVVIPEHITQFVGCDVDVLVKVADPTLEQISRIRHP